MTIQEIDARAFALYTIAIAAFMGGNPQAAIPALQELRVLRDKTKQ